MCSEQMSANPSFPEQLIRPPRFAMKRNLDSSAAPEEGPALKRAHSDFGVPDRRSAEASNHTKLFSLQVIYGF